MKYYANSFLNQMIIYKLIPRFFNGVLYFVLYLEPFDVHLFGSHKLLNFIFRGWVVSSKLSIFGLLQLKIPG